MKKRLVQNYVTTFIGVGFLAFGAYLQYAGHEATSWGQSFTMGLLFLRSKDSLIGLPEK